MQKEAKERELWDYLNSLPISTLRIIGREKGVAQPSSCNKEKLIASIVDLLMGRAEPAPRNNRGAPVKTAFVDPEIVNTLKAIQEKYSETSEPLRFELKVESSEPQTNIFDQPVSTGILEITQAGYGFLRARNCQPSVDGDVFIPAPIIHSLRLREGDLVACTTKPKLKSDSAAVEEVLSVNAIPIGYYERRPFFDNLTAKYSKEKIELSANCNDISLRLLDLFAPIGKGQRALIIAPPKAGKTTLLKSVAHAIAENHNEIHLIILLIDERPEEVTDIRESVPNAELVYSTFDEGADHHIRAAELTMEHAKRLVEHGKDVIILLDSLTKLTRAYNFVVESTGKTLTGGLDAAAFAEPKRFFGAARNTVEAGSLTILATALVETGSRMDDIIYEEFKGTGNSDIFLSRDLAERRIFPAIDIRRSGTRKEELLLTPDELAAVYKLRERGLTENVAGIIDMIKRTESNADFVARIPEWLKVYKTM